MPTRGFSVRLYFPTGEPRGLRIIERSGWTGQGIVFPRGALQQAKQREELKRTGVYVLWDRDPAGVVPQVYIGQSDNVLSRLVEHEKGKDFWTDAIAFTSKDDHFNSAHARYIESELVQRAKVLEMCKLENSNEPNSPRVSEADADDAQHFLDEIVLCLPIVGLSSFESTSNSVRGTNSSEDLNALYIDYRGSKSKRLNGILASGFVTVDGFVVREGSFGPKEVQPGWSNTYPRERARREQLVESGVLESHSQLPNAYRFTRDYQFSSSSQAAGIVLGGSYSGPQEWKDMSGTLLKDMTTGIKE